MTARILSALLAVALTAPWLGAEEPPAGPTTSSTSAPAVAFGEEEPLDLGFTSPQSTVRGFLVASRAGDPDTAAKHLDLRRLPKDQRAGNGARVARQLRTVLDRTLWIDPDTLSDSPDGDRDDGLPARRDLVGTIRTARGPVDVVVERTTEVDGTPAWKFASAFVARIPELHAEYGDGPLAPFLPGFMLEIEVLTVRLWQWLALLLLLAVGLLLAWLTSGPLLRLLGFVVPPDRRHQSERLLARVKGPLRLIIVIVVLAAGAPWLALSVPAASTLRILRKVASTAVVTWLWLRIVDVVAAIADDRLRLHGRAAAVSVIPLGRRTLKIFVAIMAAIAVVQNLGYDATGIIAGLGVGGLALALAAQKTVENLFGGVMLITDQPVRVGDLCRFGSRTGTVEDIGLRSTRIRTLERTLVSVPNAEFASTPIENLAARDRTLLDATVGLRLTTTPAQLRAVLDGLRALVAAAPRVDRESVQVRLVAVTATAFDVQLRADVLTRDWNEFAAVRERIYLDMLDVLDRAGTGLAGTPAAPARPA